MLLAASQEDERRQQGNRNRETSTVGTDTCYQVAMTLADNSVLYGFVKLRK